MQVEIQAKGLEANPKANILSDIIFLKLFMLTSLFGSLFFLETYSFMGFLKGLFANCWATDGLQENDILQRHSDHCTGNSLFRWTLGEREGTG